MSSLIFLNLCIVIKYQSKLSCLSLCLIWITYTKITFGTKRGSDYILKWPPPLYNTYLLTTASGEASLERQGCYIWKHTTVSACRGCIPNITALRGSLKKCTTSVIAYVGQKDIGLDVVYSRLFWKCLEAALNVSLWIPSCAMLCFGVSQRHQTTCNLLNTYCTMILIC